MMREYLYALNAIIVVILISDEYLIHGGREKKNLRRS